MPMDSGRAGTRVLSLTGWVGVALGVGGAVLLFFGWWGISGESVVALQLAYVASASIPGAAMVIAGAAMLAGESARRSASDSAQLIATLYDLLTVASDAPAEPGQRAGDPHPQALVTVPGGNRYHRTSCALVEGKAGVTTVDAAAIAANALQPCPVCNPVLTDP